MSNLTEHGLYMVKYYGEWMTATLCSDASVKEKFFITADGDIILQCEVDDCDVKLMIVT